MADPPPIEISKVTSDADQEVDLWDAEEQSKQIPAQLANRLYVKHESGFLRLTFGEQMGDEIVYRASFAVPNAIAFEMGDLLTRMAEANLKAQAQAWREWVADHPEEPESNA